MIEHVIIILILLYIIYGFNQLEPFVDNNSKQIIVYWFHRPGCPHCDNMKHAWQMLKKELPPKYLLKDINTSLPRNNELADKYKVEGIPHIVKVKGSKYVVYSGDRSTSDMKKWVIEEW